MLAGFGDVVEEFLHVPGGGGAAFGAEAAVEADVFVFGHDAERLRDGFGDVEVLREVEGRNLSVLAKLGFGLVGRERDAARRADVHARVALDAFRSVKDRLHVAVETPLGLFVTGERVEAFLDLLLAVF